MKKGILALLSIFILCVGCSRIERECPTQEVIFQIGCIRSGEINTKATVTEFLRDIQPISSPTLLIESLVDRSFYVEVTPGQAVELPLGGYRVTATYKKSIIGSVGGYSVSEEPIYKIDEEVTVNPNQQIYYLTGIYQCWALVINYLDTDHYMMDGNNFNMVRDNIGEKGVLFISTIEPGYNWTLVSYPKDAVNYGTATFTIGENRAGYWYCYSPTQKEKQSGLFCINLPDWEEAL